MSRALKTGLPLLAIPLFVVPSLLLGLSAAAPMLAERIGLARSIETAVFAATGQRLLLATEPRLRLLPHPLIELGPLTLSGQHPGSAPLARAARLRIRFAGLPLLTGRAELAEITLDGVQLPAPADRANAEPESKKLESKEPASENTASAETGQPRIHDARLRLHYPDGGTTWSLIPFDRVPIRAGGTGRLDAVIELTGYEPTLQGTLRLSAAVAPSADLSKLHFSNLQLRGSDLAIGEGRGLALALDANVDYGFDDHDWRIDGLALTSGSLRVDGDLALSPSTLPAVVSGTFRIAGFDPRVWMQRHGYGPGRGTPSTLRCAAARGRFVLTGDELRLEPTLLRIDATHAAGAVAARFGPMPSMALALALDGLDLDPYLASTPSPTPEQAQAPVPVPALAQGFDCTLPIESPIAAADLPPRSSESALRARIDAGVLRVDGLRYGQLAVEIEGDRALIGVDVEAADFYGGQLVARMDRDARIANAPRQALRGRAADIDIAALLTDLQGVAPISGTGNISAELAGSGLDPAAIKADLSGTVAVDIRDGRLLGLDLAALITAAGGDADDAAAATAFSSLRATATGSGGRFVSQDIDARSPRLRVSGQGRFDVPAETLDLDLETVFVDPPEGRGPRGLGGIRVPLRVVGDWQQPAWKPDLGPALREGTRRLLDRNRDALKQLEERAGLKGLEQGLRGLLGF